MSLAAIKAIRISSPRYGLVTVAASALPPMSAEHPDHARVREVFARVDDVLEVFPGAHVIGCREHRPVSE